jgi:hypothetical protein
MKSYKFKFRGKELSRTQVKNNILAVLNTADKDSFGFGMRWYTIANGIAVNLTGEGVNQAQAVGVIAALSPLKSWKQNIKLAREFVFEGKRSGHTGVMVKKAADILALNNPTTDQVIEILRGQKITNFFLNIYYPNKDVVVTIDRHSVGVALLGSGRIPLTEKEVAPTKKQFEFLLHCYKWTAAELDISAVQLQAITWEHFRKIKAKK